MKFFLLASLLVVAVGASLFEERGDHFQAFKEAHGKTYKNQAEETKRFAIFSDNLRTIDEHNALYEQGQVTYKLGITKFADMTQEEFEATLTLHPKPIFNGTKYIPTGAAVPASIDWRSKGYVTAVKDQGQCGSCWSFSVTGSTEGAYFRKTGKLVSLSEQQLVDCTKNINDGCNGGYMVETFPYLEKNGLEAESAYRYTAKDGRCQYDASKVVTKVNSYVYHYNNEAATHEAVGTVGPVSIGINAKYLSLYHSGIYTDSRCDKKEINHGVLAVGYGTQNGENYWIVKNSWGHSFGESGYFRIRRGTNECGVGAEMSYPVIH